MKRIAAIALALVMFQASLASAQFRQSGTNYITAHSGELPDGEKVTTVRYGLGIAMTVLKANKLIPWDVEGYYEQDADWDLFDDVFDTDSAKFRAYNHQPGVGVNIPIDVMGLSSFRAGYEHKSTGEDGAQSLSVNRVQTSVDGTVEGDLLTFDYTVTLWYVTSKGENTGDYSDYYGFGLGAVEDLGGEVRFSITHANGGTLSATVSMATISGTLEFDVIPGLNDYQVFIAGWSGKDYMLGGINEPDTSGYGIGLSLAH